MDEKTILFLGDSFTEGYGIREEQSFPSQIERRLEIQDGKTTWTVINGGVSGDTTMDAYYRLSPLLKRHDPVDYMMVFLGANDMFNRVNPDFSYKYMASIIEDARKHNPEMKIYVVRLPALPMLEGGDARRFESIYDRIETDFDVEMLPFFLEGILLNDDLCLPDGVHPNAEGMRLVAERVWKSLFLERILSGSPSS